MMRIRHVLQNRLPFAVATCCGAGLIGIAPGTWGAIAAWPLHRILMMWAERPLHWGLVAVLAIAGGFAAHAVSDDCEDDDPQCIVIDEFVGCLIALAAAGSSLGTQVAAIVLFRVFDILKPWPVSTLEHLRPAGLGIMADDVAAGVISAGLILLILALLS